MRIININEAAKLLHMSREGLRRKALAGDIPAAKPGKCWIFNLDDIAAYIRSRYVLRQEDKMQRNNKISVECRR